VATILFKLLAPKGSLWIGNGVQNLAAGVVLLLFAFPPLGMLFAWIILGEHVEIRDLMGNVPVALGIYLVTRPAAASRQ
jgi:drug/metabolite transporter (DMT)-like permease